jgi:hypothetical protein
LQPISEASILSGELVIDWDGRFVPDFEMPDFALDFGCRSASALRQLITWNAALSR